MAYLGGQLQSLFPSLPAVRAARQMADDGGSEMLKAAKAATPVRTGETRDAWRKHPVRKRRLGLAGDEYTSEIENSFYKAHWLENGTQDHFIKPDTEGGAVSTPAGPRSESHVRGIRPRKMSRQAAAAAEASMDAITRPGLQRWKAETEGQAKRAKGVS